MAYKDLDFKKKVVLAAQYAKNGDPIKDVLSEADMVESVVQLARIYQTEIDSEQKTRVYGEAFEEYY